MQKAIAFVMAAAALCLTSCADVGRVAGGGSGLERAPKLPLNLDPPAIDFGKQVVALPSYSKQSRDDYALLWMLKSDELCGPYESRLVVASRDSRLVPDLLATALAGLATIFTPVNTVRALAGAASITSASGAVFQSDTFGGQIGEALTSAIETARGNQANQIRKNLLQQNEQQYSLYAALRDVTIYHNMCSLDQAMRQIRSSLQLTKPDGGTTPPAKEGQQETGGIPPQAKTIVNAQTILSNPQAPLQHVPTLPPPGPVSQQEVALIQKALCVEPTGSLGARGSASQLAITQYFNRSPVQLTRATVEDLFKAVEKVGDCRAKGYLNAFEVRQYGVSGVSVAALQGQLSNKLSNVAPPLQAGGQFDPATRQAIAEVRKRSQQRPALNGQMDNALTIWLLQHPEPFPKDNI